MTSEPSSSLEDRQRQPRPDSAFCKSLQRERNFSHRMRGLAWRDEARLRRRSRAPRASAVADAPGVHRRLDGWVPEPISGISAALVPPSDGDATPPRCADTATARAPTAIATGTNSARPRTAIRRCMSFLLHRACGTRTRASRKDRRTPLGVLSVDAVRPFPEIALWPPGAFVILIAAPAASEASAYHNGRTGDHTKLVRCPPGDRSFTSDPLRGHPSFPFASGISPKQR